jgi:AcrR family transcriptional regulator
MEYCQGVSFNATCGKSRNLLSLDHEFQALASNIRFKRIDKPLAHIYNPNKNFSFEEQQGMTVERKIINATIECIENYGLQGATSRRIAEMAGINNASINYYFRTKDILIAQTLSITLDNAFDFDNFESHAEDSPTQRCVTIFNDLIIGGLKYPGITRAHFYPVLVDGKYSHEVVARLNLFASQLTDDLIARGCPLPLEDLRLAIAQAILSVMMAIIAPALFYSGLQLNLADPNHRQRFVTRLVNRLFSEETNG